MESFKNAYSVSYDVLMSTLGFLAPFAILLIVIILLVVTVTIIDEKAGK